VSWLENERVTTRRWPPFDPTRFEQFARERGLTLGRPCHYLPVTGSTSDDLLAAARADAPAGTLYLADLQTKGRGRHGNSWYSPNSAENLLFSVLLRPRFPVATASGFTLAAGLAVREAVQPHLTMPVGIKWTNDVFANQHKLAGILVESQLRGSALSALVVGVGLNVQMTELPEEIATIATSLRLLGASCLDRELLLTEILAALELRAAEYEQHGLRGCLDELREHDVTRGRRIRVGPEIGIARGISDTGGFVLERETDGKLVELCSGLVEILEPGSG
jgi:BirA family transcriptional regulator, biotin operon repressor / biotin---[acetyl-CoA-carboxylase] ligase